jgi:hypothetical protein
MGRILRAIRNNTFCDTLGQQEKSSYEKIHTKYCKTVLGLKKLKFIEGKDLYN